MLLFVPKSTIVSKWLNEVQYVMSAISKMIIKYSQSIPCPPFSTPPPPPKKKSGETKE